MLLVQSTHPKDKQYLQQHSSRSGNMFQIHTPTPTPTQSPEILKTLLDNIIYQIFGSDRHTTRSGSKLMLLLAKFCNFVDGVLGNVVSFTIVREIFQIVRQEVGVIGMYEEYVRRINQCIVDEASEDQQQNISYYQNNQQSNTQLQQKFLYNFLSPAPKTPPPTLPTSSQHSRTEHTSSNPQIDFHSADRQIRSKIYKIDDIQSHDNEYDNGYDNKYDNAHDNEYDYDYDCEQVNTMHTLRSQLNSPSPKFCGVGLLGLRVRWSGGGNEDGDYRVNGKQKQKQLQYNQQQQQVNSFTDTCNTHQQHQNTQQTSIPTPTPNPKINATNPPSTTTIPTTTISTNSQPTNPTNRVPSFLHAYNEQSMNDLINREKREDVRNSDILRKSMRGAGAGGGQLGGGRIGNYSERIREIKFLNKIRSRRNININPKQKHKQPQTYNLSHQQPLQIPQIKQKDSTKKTSKT